MTTSEIIAYAIKKDRDEAIKNITRLASSDFMSVKEQMGLLRAIDVIKELPSVQIEIIRCKNCIYRRERCENWHIEEYVEELGLDGAMFVPDGNFSCIYAEC